MVGLYREDGRSRGELVVGKKQDTCRGKSGGQSVLCKTSMPLSQ